MTPISSAPIRNAEAANPSIETQPTELEKPGMSKLTLALIVGIVVAIALLTVVLLQKSQNSNQPQPATSQSELDVSSIVGVIFPIILVIISVS
jgi:heme/copper-type cytochrome/quinol oxidase subunit 2